MFLQMGNGQMGWSCLERDCMIQMLKDNTKAGQKSNCLNESSRTFKIFAQFYVTRHFGNQYFSNFCPNMYITSSQFNDDDAT